MAAKKEIIVRRGDIYLVNFDPTIGSEIKKTRPALIIQNDVANKYSPIVIVAAITSQLGPPYYPNEVFVKTNESGLKNDSVILLNQIRSIDKQRLVKKIGKIKSTKIVEVDHAIAISIGLKA